MKKDTLVSIASFFLSMETKVSEITNSIFIFLFSIQISLQNMIPTQKLLLVPAP